MIDFAAHYHRYEDIPAALIAAAERMTVSSPFRQGYHIEPNSGYLNDPNGFSYFDGQYHLFYQWSPLRYIVQPEVWYQGWFHLVSDDLVNWKAVGPGLEPDTKYDTHGSYSGSALVDGKELLLFYTGNTRDEQWNRTPYQVMARMDRNGMIQKIEPPGFAGLIDGYTDHFRDPKLWKKQDRYYAIVGIQRENLSGACIILHSPDAVNWDVLGELQTHYSSLGYMWECPDYFELQEKGVLIFSPQGMEAEKGKYQNIYQTGYLIGEPLLLPELAFAHGEFIELDYGFDFYATQTMTSPDGRRILIGWMGLPEISYPTEAFGYCGCLTIPRELSIHEDRLIQQPIIELKSLRGEHQHVEKNMQAGERFKLRTGARFELELNMQCTEAEHVKIGIRANDSCDAATWFYIDTVLQYLTIDRSRSGMPVAEEYGTIRRLDNVMRESIKLHLFVDQSSVEIFVNDGDKTASSRIFPKADQNWLCIECNSGQITFDLDIWTL